MNQKGAGSFGSEGGNWLARRESADVEHFGDLSRRHRTSKDQQCRPGYSWAMLRKRCVQNVKLSNCGKSGQERTVEDRKASEEEEIECEDAAVSVGFIPAEPDLWRQGKQREILVLRRQGHARIIGVCVCVWVCALPYHYSVCIPLC